METPNFTLLGIDHVNFRLRSSLGFARHLSQVWGFEEFAYAGRQTGRKDVAARVLRQDKIIFSLSNPMQIGSPMIKSLDTYGEGIDDIAFAVSDVRAVYNHVVEHKGIAISRPQDFTEMIDGKKRVVMTQAAMGSCGRVEHTLIDRSHYTGVFAPGYVKVETPIPHAPPVGLVQIDHYVLNVEAGQMDPWADYYRRTLGFREILRFSEKQISTDTAALRSVVMRSENGAITSPINEPVEEKPSHIDEFLDDMKGPGVQHIALLSNDIVATVGLLRERGEQFIDVPDAYYDATPARLKRAGLKTEIPQALMDDLRRLRLLIDGDEHGYLIQTFTKVMLGNGAGFFIEIIQRCGDDGFGEGNFLALFEAIERAAGR
ncbi:4-hydroxyphenylpyruvate dioxygenase [Candidatus Kaiserbacteria bacterium]|nr:4-hydroxyphenylpyruvate dioxygenase [Candidatus Kaiserbacteria bacterium]